ncbi:HAD-IIB family hydrolase [Pseudoflavonifractor sp. An187]|uniref:HAD-IIB family hydrolase n=1 Tax=Pseudoflavonifractor sp. An187 TaxID=1965578 RepID=UPI0023B955DA|nr:HAD-IIB family hydrolase [Pseudoflavonifractor sp. An187]
MSFSIIREEPAPLAQQASSFLLSRLAITIAPLEAFRQWVLEEYPQQLDAFFSCQAHLEIIPRGLSKGNALVQLAQRLGIPIENTVAAGDAANDLSLLRAAGIGVAMCNGTDEAKAAADAVTCRDNNHDGMAEIIEKYLVHR